MLTTPAWKRHKQVTDSHPFASLFFALSITASLVLLLFGLTKVYQARETIYLSISVSDITPGHHVPHSLTSILPPRYHLNEHHNATLPKVFLFVPASKIVPVHSKMGPEFCSVVQAAIVNGWSPIIFNWNLRKNFNYNKPLEFAKLLDSPIHTHGIDSNDLVLMIDALDVWLQLPPEHMTARFLERYDEEIVAGAEKNCWPPDADCDKHAASPLPADLYQDGVKDRDSGEAKPPIHVNSGTVIGRLHRMQEFYRDVAVYMRSNDYEWKPFDDQGAFNVRLAQGRLKIDYDSRLFWNAFMDESSIGFINTPRAPGPSVSPIEKDAVPWDQYPPLGHHRRTGRIPVALHFNGNTKHWMKTWSGLSWWNSKRDRFKEMIRSRMDAGKLRISTKEGYNEVGVKEMCPMLEVWGDQTT